MKQKIKPEICVLDGDGLLFEAALAGEQVWYDYHDQDGNLVASFKDARAGNNWIDEIQSMGIDMYYGYTGDADSLIRTTRYEIKDVELCYKAFKKGLKRILKLSKCKEVRCYLSKKSGFKVFRYQLATIHEYKKGRSNSRKPHYLEAVRKFANTLPEVRTVRGRIEVDDKVVQEAESIGAKACLVAADKDALQVKGAWILHLGKHDHPVWSDPNIVGRIGKRKDGSVKRLGWLALMFQMFTGDKQTDGIVGLPKYGDVKAYNILKPFDNKPIKHLPDVVRAVLREYLRVYGSTHTYTHWDGSVEITASFRDMFEENLLQLYMRRFNNDHCDEIMSIVRHIDEEELMREIEE